jgi:hypothetical protein
MPDEGAVLLAGAEQVSGTIWCRPSCLAEET